MAGGKRTRKPHNWHRAGYVWSIIINIVVFFVVNEWINWNFSFIRPGFDALIFFFNISLMVNVVCNIFLLAYDAEFVKNILKIITDIVGLMVVYMALAIFPFEFGWFDVYLRVIFIIGIVAILVSIVVKIIRLIADA